MIEGLKSILEDIKGQPGLAATLDASTNILEDVGLDSLEMLHLMLGIEQQLQIEIDFARMDFSQLQSLGSLAQFLGTLNRLGEPTPAADTATCHIST